MTKDRRAIDEYHRLQDDFIRQLEAITEEVEAGRLDVDEGGRLADTIAKEAEARTADFKRELSKQASRSKTLLYALCGIAALAFAYLVSTMATHFA